MKREPSPSQRARCMSPLLGVPHFVWAKESEVTYQETGMGPTGTVFIHAESPP